MLLFLPVLIHIPLAFVLINPLLCVNTTSNKKHFKEMNSSYVGTTMVKKEQGQDDYFNQQSQEYIRESITPCIAE